MPGCWPACRILGWSGSSIRCRRTERPIVITNTAYRFMVQEQLADIALEADVLLDPMRRDSGPAIAADAVFAQARDDDAAQGRPCPRFPELQCLDRQGAGRAGRRRRSVGGDPRTPCWCRGRRMQWPEAPGCEIEIHRAGSDRGSHQGPPSLGSYQSVDNGERHHAKCTRLT
jgi:hypothetical protein